MRHSKNYVMTAHVKSAGDMLELETVRKAVKIINRENKRLEERKLSGSSNQIVKYPRFYVKAQGRGPRTASALADGKHARKYDQSLPLSHATHMDVYIYERYQEEGFGGNAGYIS